MGSRTRQILIRVSDPEMAAIEHLVEIEGSNCAAVVRSLTIKELRRLGYLPPPAPAPYGESAAPTA